jgi:hypothetical protein
MGRCRDVRPVRDPAAMDNPRGPESNCRNESDMLRSPGGDSPSACARRTITVQRPLSVKRHPPSPFSVNGKGE